jgi:hypothetical protein
MDLLKGKRGGSEKKRVECRIGADPGRTALGQPRLATGV